MEHFHIIKTPPYYKILDCDIISVLSNLKGNENLLLFLNIYHEDDIKSFLASHKIIRLANVLQIQGSNNMLSFHPYIKTREEISEEYKKQDWDFTCIVLDKYMKELFYIRGLEEESMIGIKIKEIEPGLYNKYLKNYKE